MFATNLTELPSPKIYDNVTAGERNAINSLKNNPDIVITAVDKGSSVVIMNRCDYINCIDNVLHDASTYKKLPKNRDKKILKQVKDFTTKFSQCFDINGKEVEYLTEFDIKSANFYGLIKIHKSHTLINVLKSATDTYIKTPFPPDYPIRCITAGVDAPTSKLSEILHHILLPLCKKVPSHIRDYVDFLSKMRTVTQEELEDIILITCDIISMYPNLHIDLGLRAVKYWLHMFPEEVLYRFSEECILTALELVLRNSTFMFNGEYFSSIKGTATGTTVAPTYATLTIAFLEIELYSKIRTQYGDTVCKYFIDNWKRFLDDCFILWKKSFGDFSGILDILNNLDPSLNFTCEQSDTGLSFLNLFVYKDAGIKTDIFYKDTDSHDYLPFNSCHPRHIKINIPGNLARMICTIVDDPVRKDHRLRELKTWLRNAGYPKRLINNKINQFKFKNTQYLRNKVNYEKSDRVLVFVQKHNPKNPHVYNYLLNAFNSLTATTKFSEIFKNTKTIKSVRQPPNLGRMLQKHDVSTNHTPNGIVKCGRSNCGTCDYIVETDAVQFYNTLTNVETNFKILRPFSCISGGLIYKINCRGNCGNLFYLGQTVELRQRVTKHKSDFRHVEQKIIDEENIMKLHLHLHHCANNVDPPFEIIPFYQVRQGTLTARLTIEKYFIRKFHPTLNGR